MRDFFADSSVPELTGLNDSHRHAVLERARLLVDRESPGLADMPSILCFAFAPFGWFGGAHLFASFFSGDWMIDGFFWSNGGALLAGLLGGLIGARFLRARLRSSIRRILREDEIFHVGSQLREVQS